LTQLPYQVKPTMGDFPPARVREVALEYAARGWCVHPLVPSERRPIVSDWTERTTTDIDLIRWTWTPGSAYIRCGIGCRCSGLIVIDLDSATCTGEAVEPPRGSPSCLRDVGVFASA
jgi:Bifunctional DNA primase/polymerase, N-terminal